MVCCLGSLNFDNDMPNDDCLNHWTDILRRLFTGNEVGWDLSSSPLSSLNNFFSDAIMIITLVYVF